MRFIFNATPLIHLAKAGLISMIHTLEGEKYTVPAVFHEVVEIGKANGYTDAIIIEDLINKKIINIRTPTASAYKTISSAHKDIYKGEEEVIALAKDIGAIAVIDDSVARAVAKMHGVRVEGTYGIILRALFKGSISKDVAEDSLQALVSSGWRCDIELYSKLIRLIRRGNPKAKS